MQLGYGFLVLNEMKNLVLGSKSHDAQDDRGGMQNEIFFIGG